MFRDDVIAWIKTTQPKSWDALEKTHGCEAASVVLKRLRASLDQRGTLEVLRQGFEMLGLREAVKLAQFKPALAMNPDILSRYQANRLRVIRQVRYSLHNENAIDLVLFLNITSRPTEPDPRPDRPGSNISKCFITASDFIPPMATCRQLATNRSLKRLSCVSGKVLTHQPSQRFIQARQARDS